MYLRPVVPADEQELRRAVKDADPETIRTRFLGGGPPHSEQQFKHLVCLDYTRRLAIAAFAPDGRGVGIARYEALGDGSTAEVALAVDREWRHVGLATALVKLLAAGAVHNGIARFEAEFFADNLDVSDLLSETGAPYEIRNEHGVVDAHVTLPPRGSSSD